MRGAVVEANRITPMLAAKRQLVYLGEANRINLTPCVAGYYFMSVGVRGVGER